MRPNLCMGPGCVTKTKKILYKSLINIFPTVRVQRLLIDVEANLRGHQALGGDMISFDTISSNTILPRKKY